MMWPKKVEEAYWRWFIDARVPIYLEWMIDLKEQMRKTAEEVGINLNWEHYTPLLNGFLALPTWSRIRSMTFILLLVPRYRAYGSCTMETPWLDEVSKMRPHTYGISMSSDTAKQKNLQQGDFIEVESSHGHKVRGRLALRKGQHPETLAIVSAGKWSKAQPVAEGKGVCFTTLLETKFEDCDPMTLNMETCVRVKVRKVKGKKSD